MTKLHSTLQISNLIQRYIDLGGECHQIEEGVLGHGTLLLTGAPQRRHIVVREVPVNEWNSLHRIRQYNKLPIKYQKILSL